MTAGLRTIPARVCRGLVLALAVAATAISAGCAGVDGSATDTDRTPSGRRVASAPPAAADIRPEQLLGLDSDRLIALLGPADFARDDGPARIWQFRDPLCVLDVFLYAGPGGETFMVEHVEARDRTLARSADAECVESMLRERRGRSAAATS